MAKRIALVNSANPWIRTAHLPSTLNVGARLLVVGFDALIIDLNLTTLAATREELLVCDFVGFTVLGTMFLPNVQADILRLRSYGYTRPILIGGEGVARLDQASFRRFFPHGTYGDIRFVVEDEDLAPALRLLLRRIPPREEVSIRPMLERLSPDHRRAYLLGGSPALYLSDGCIFKCKFCAARKGRPETYRAFEPLRDEVGYIAAQLAGYGMTETNFYASPLDLLQHPSELEVAFQAANEACAPHGITFRARGLATTSQTRAALQKDPRILERLHALGLHTIAFGVDAVSKQTCREQNKGHNSMADYERCRDACRAAGIHVEMLIVIGFPKEPWRDRLATIRACLEEEYLNNVTVRLYLAKMYMPGGGIWEEDASIRERFFEDPSRLRDLEYSMLLTENTCEDTQDRWTSNAIFLALQLALLPHGWINPPLLPLSRSSKALAGLARRWNGRMPPDR